VGGNASLSRSAASPALRSLLRASELLAFGQISDWRRRVCLSYDGFCGQFHRRQAASLF
jgi:hypothetical protein